MSEFYGIKPGTVPGFAEAGTGRFIGVGSLPEDTVQHMLAFMEKLRDMCRDDELAFEICIRHVASVIEDQRRVEGKNDPREDPASLGGHDGSEPPGCGSRKRYAAPWGATYAWLSGTALMHLLTQEVPFLQQADRGGNSWRLLSG
jgi:hypothetical protein